MTPIWVSTFSGQDQSGTWSVSSADRVDIIAASVNSDVTYRVHVDQSQGDVEVVVRNANGDKVHDRCGKVEGGDSRDFDIDQGWSIEVRYASASSTGTYQRL